MKRTKCPRCGHEWDPKVPRPKECPRCKQRLDSEPQRATGDRPQAVRGEGGLPKRVYKAKWVISWLSLLLMFAFTLVVYITFLWIYFHPGDSYFITLTLFGERELEFVLLAVLAPIVLVGFLWNAKLLLRHPHD